VLARSGVFRLRSVLIGTVAYQVYPAMLGVRLLGALLQTSDVDVAQFTSVSISSRQMRELKQILRIPVKVDSDSRLSWTGLGCPR
jgi:hypothetical protein